MKKMMSVLLMSCAGFVMLVPNAAAQSKSVYTCDGGRKIAITGAPENDSQITVNWNKRNHKLSRIDTSTGANRFENRKAGLVWINIPAKGILLDSKKGRPLANGCKN